MSGYRLQPRVSAALEDIHRYSTARWGEPRADAYILGFFDLFERIASRDELWRAIPADLRTTGFRSRYERHLVYWVPARDGTVIIFALLHERMHQFERLNDIVPDNDRADSDEP